MADATDADRVAVAELLGREPQGDLDIVVRDESGQPLVIRNAPLLDDGTPMPTRYWLVGARDRQLVGRLEGAGGVRRAEAAVEAAELAAAHARYETERNAALPVGHTGPRAAGGVGGTRRGVKCLHAHYAWHLAGGDDPVGRWVADHLHEVDDRGDGAPTSDEVLAAIDCGTNSTRLLISRGGHSTVERLAAITKLGKGVDETGRLAPSAIERVVTCLRSYREVMDQHGVRRMRMTATSAARDAANRDDFFDAAEAVVGVRPELLSGAEEGQLSFRGATAELDPTDGPFLVVDVGGGSTEFAVGGAEFDDAISVDMGCVRLSEKFLPSDRPRPEELSNCLSVVGTHLIDVQRELSGVGAAKRLVGVAGTVNAVAAIEQGLPEYDRDKIHHFVLTKEAVEDVFRTLATETAAERAENPGLEPGRVDTIVGGMCIVVKIMRDYGFAEMLVSETDILDGLILSQLGVKSLLPPTSPA